VVTFFDMDRSSERNCRVPNDINYEDVFDIEKYLISVIQLKSRKCVQFLKES
jgi:hypothetical protein